MNPNNTTFKNYVLIDSNFIPLPIQYKIDYLDEIILGLEGRTLFIVFKQIYDELEAKKKRIPNAVKFQQQIKSGINYLEKNIDKYDIIFKEETKNSSETTDDFLLRMSVDLKDEGVNVYLATNDQELRRKAKTALIGVIFLRQKKYLSIERS